MYDQEKVDDVVLALLHLNAFEQGGAVRAWEGSTGTPSTASMSAA